MGHAQRVSGRRAHRAAVAAVAAVAAGTLLAGCGGDDGAAAEEKADGVPVYFVDGSGKLESVAQDVDGAGKMRAQGRAVAAVEALMSVAPEKDSGLISHWGGQCGIGAGVDSLEQKAGVVTIEVRGAAGVACDRKGVQAEQQKQQLAWTVVQNLGADAGTAVRMYGPNGAPMWPDVVADKKFLAG